MIKYLSRVLIAILCYTVAVRAVKIPHHPTRVVAMRTVQSLSCSIDKLTTLDVWCPIFGSAPTAYNSGIPGVLKCDFKLSTCRIGQHMNVPFSVNGVKCGFCWLVFPESSRLSPTWTALGHCMHLRSFTANRVEFCVNDIRRILKERQFALCWYGQVDYLLTGKHSKVYMSTHSAGMYA